MIGLPICEISLGEESSISRRSNHKRSKRTISSSSPSGSDTTMCSENETESCRASARPRARPPTRASKKLPTEEERIAELRHAPSANLAVNILEVADSLEQMASTANNLKGTYVRRLRDDADKARPNATELAKRTTSAGAQIALEQENLQLRAKLQKAEEEIAELRKKSNQRDKDGKGDRIRPAKATEKQMQEEVHPKPPKQVQVLVTRANQRQGMAQEGEYQSAMREIQSLTKQVSALRDLVWQFTQVGRPSNLREAERQELQQRNAGILQARQRG